ncbi:hypothetical protein INT46_010233 [Mucor plumbeus]|uniref:Uncharacterized protein n=1 Tax=Mucor plumbeus TaxID=97098 RepID=A0A8H7QEB0_9FUNG|nr:hypothetical protein INT46_010233 [Mucor plumbeus]
MPYNNETTYTKLDEKDLPSYTDTINSKSLMLPEITHKHIEDYSISSQYQHFNSQDIEKPSSSSQQLPSTTSRRCRLVTHIFLITGITFLVLAAVFKVESRSHISTSIENDCPANCITSCYSKLPFYQESLDCNPNEKQHCDIICDQAGMNSAKIYSILFLVFVSLGGLFVFVQFISSFVRYFCLDYYNLNKNP